MSAETTSLEPVGKLAALRERWALVRAKLSTWWASNNKTAAWLAAMATLLIGALLLTTCYQDAGLEQPPAAAQAQPATAQADDATAAAAQQPASNAQATPQRRTAARPMPAPQPMPQAAPAAQQAAPSAWGTTDLDRAIADFDPATAAPKAITHTTTGAQP